MCRRCDHPIMTDQTLPPAPETPTTAQHGDATDSDSDLGSDRASIEVLHVEPDSRSAELLGAFFKRFAERIRVRSADDMETALSDADTADCVVTEQRLSDGSGVGLVERLRRRGDETPVVFHTTCRGEDTGRKAMDAGADAYFEKRSERGQYDRVLERVRELVDGGDHRDDPMSPMLSAETDGSTGGTVRSEE